jgi:hypothetical protein
MTKARNVVRIGRTLITRNEPTQERKRGLDLDAQDQAVDKRIGTERAELSCVGQGLAWQEQWTETHRPEALQVSLHRADDFGPLPREGAERLRLARVQRC